MLRIYFLQQWFNMSDSQAEDSLYGSVAKRNFVGIDLGNEAAPDPEGKSMVFWNEGPYRRRMLAAIARRKQGEGHPFH